MKSKSNQRPPKLGAGQGAASDSFRTETNQSLQNATHQEEEESPFEFADAARGKAEMKILEDLARKDQTLSLVDYKLQDLQLLAAGTGALSGAMLSELWDTTQEVNLSRNFLSSIDALNQFRNLRFLTASENYIVEVTLSLPRLEKLDLRQNFIQKFPILNQLPKLRELNLAHNRLEDIRPDFKAPSCLSLLGLDLSHNQIYFSSNQDFYEQMLESVKKLKNLKCLELQGNPFLSQVELQHTRLEQIVAQLPNLEELNSERVEVYRKAPAQQKPGPPQQPGKAKPTKGGDKKGLYIPTLETLCFNLEAANSHPSFALDHLRDLAFDVEKISEHLDLVDEHFAKGRNEDDINDLIEDFMQNAQVLINNHFELQSIMLTVLSKLTIVKFHDFGVRCFNALKDLMIAGRDMEERVTDIIRREVVLKLHQQQNPEGVPASLLQGLYELVRETKKSEMLSGLYENCFPQWLRQLMARIANGKRSGTLCEDNVHFDAILALMAASLLADEEGGGASRRNAQLALEKDLGLFVADILNESTWEYVRYMHCLKIVELLSQHEPMLADQFVDKFIHLGLLKNIKYSLSVYKKYNDLKAPEDTKETEARLRLKYLTLAAEISCLGGLLESQPSKRLEILRDPLLDDLLQIVSHYKTDPLLLASICRFARQLFTREEMLLNAEELIAPKVKRMQNLVQLIPYLGMKKYEEAVRMARKYSAQQGGAASSSDKVVQLQHMDDLVVHELFISIIKLINFFCEEAEKTGASVFEEVSLSLNDASRETALFNCLEVPNDDVKLAVVECLNNVPLSEFDTEEIATIIRLLSQCKNIGAGKTELVLAKIFWIVTKLCKDKEEESGKNFRVKFGERAVSEALEILIRNQSRALEDEDEEQEKLSLSLSCVHFLKFASVNPDTKRYLLNRHEQFKRAMYVDEQCTSYEFAKIPVEIEETYLARNMDVLIYAISGAGGAETASPYTLTSFRLLQRMADVLMNYNCDELSDLVDPFQPGVDVIEQLKLHYKTKLKARKRRERTYWRDPDAEALGELLDQSTPSSQQRFSQFHKQHYWFTASNGIPLLRMFLTKKVPAYEQWLKRESESMGYDKHAMVIERSLNKAKKKAEDKELEHQRKEEERKGKALLKGAGQGDHKEDEEEEQLSGIQVLRKVLMKEELGSHYDPEAASDHLITSAKSKSQNVENIMKRDNKVGGVQNLKLRSLCIAAYLRCLHAAIEYAPTEQLKQEAITQLSDLFVFRTLTQLCDTTGWFEANIGAKYLRVMRHIIKAPLTQASEKADRLSLYEIVSKAIRKMLNQVMIKLKNEQQKPLTNEDKVLVYELAAMCQLMCRQSASLFIWSDMPVKQQGQHARTRRSPQEKVIDQQISMLFPSQNILAFIAIVFRDMDIAYKLFDEEQSAVVPKEPRFIRERSQLTRECIKSFMGDYLSKCKDYKYDILEAFMKGVVFEKKKLRESFLQEILKAHVDSGLRSSIEAYLLDQKFVFEPDERERIVSMQWVEAASNMAVAHQPRLLIMTNKGFHIMRPPNGKPCTVCPPENLCPNGPRVEHRLKYDKLSEIIYFGAIQQRLVLSFSQKGLTSTKGATTQGPQGDLQVCIIIPTFSGLQEVREILDEVCTQFSPRTGLKQMRDFLLPLSLKRFLADERLITCQYLSLSQGKGFLSFGTGAQASVVGGYADAVIPNCVLVVVTTSELIILKENWLKWMLVEDEGMLESLIEKMEGGVSGDGELIPQAQRLQEVKLRASIEGIFQVQARYKVDEIENLHVHRGKDPILELEFPRNRVEKLAFPCDFSRQSLIKHLIDAKNGVAGEDSSERLSHSLKDQD